MTGERRRWAGRVLKLSSVVMLLAAVASLVKGGSTPQALPAPPKFRPKSSPAPASATPEVMTYLVGYGFALLLTGVAFALVHWHWTRPTTALAIVFALGLVQMVVHFRCFLHVTLSGPARDDLQLIAFSTLIILLMVGGTLVVLFNLRMRMM